MGRRAYSCSCRIHYTGWTITTVRTTGTIYHTIHTQTGPRYLPPHSHVRNTTGASEHSLDSLRYRCVYAVLYTVYNTAQTTRRHTLPHRPARHTHTAHRSLSLSCPQSRAHTSRASLGAIIAAHLHPLPPHPITNTSRRHEPSPRAAVHLRPAARLFASRGAGSSASAGRNRLGASVSAVPTGWRVQARLWTTARSCVPPSS